MTIHVVVHKINEETGKSWKVRREFDTYSEVDVDYIERQESVRADTYSNSPEITATVENIFVT